eukprot:11193888-Lingulodinium_polyedra.AAC.1
MIPRAAGSPTPTGFRVLFVRPAIGLCIDNGPKNLVLDSPLAAGTGRQARRPCWQYWFWASADSTPKGH